MGWQTAFRRWLGSPPLQRGPSWPALAAALGFAATLTFTVPMVPPIVAMVTLAPRRWVVVALAGAIGSAAAGALIIHYSVNGAAHTSLRSCRNWPHRRIGSTCSNGPTATGYSH